MSLLPRHQSSINNGAACSQWQALWKPQSQERRGECVREGAGWVSQGTSLLVFHPAREGPGSHTRSPQPFLLATALGVSQHSCSSAWHLGSY